MLWLGIGVCVAGAARAQPADAPPVAANDSWAYQDTVEKGASWQQNRFAATAVRAVKRWVWSVEEHCDRSGVRNERCTDELGSCKVAS